MELEVLRMALANDSNSKAALRRLLALGEGPDQQLVASREVLETILASGYANAFAHFVLGCQSWQSGEPEAAIFHLEHAYSLDESLGPVANNLA
ncbi:MAG: hypothetical protein ACPGLY_26720 [Rubripirellula sp.]